MTAFALVLAAGRGTRMRSSRPKVLHSLCGRSMLSWVVQAARDAGFGVGAVVGYEAEAVRAELGDTVPTALQDPPMGTGHAVQSATGIVPLDGVLVVLNGDTPLIRPETLTRLVAGHRGHCTMLSNVLSEEAIQTCTYGRVLRDGDGRVQRVIELTSCTPQQAAVREVNTGIYAFDARWLVERVLPGLKPNPPKGEYYLTDAVAAAAAAGGLQAIVHADIEETWGVNDRADLAEAERVLRARLNRRWMVAGVGMRDPITTYVDAAVELAEGVELGPGVVLGGHTRVGAGVVIEAGAVIEDTVLGEGARVEARAVLRRCRVATGAVVHAGSVCRDATIGAGATVGPMAHLRDGAELAEGVRIGNFVEVKKSRVGAGAKVSHLSYVGDATVGDAANIGAGAITCNYDGFAKHHTDIGAGAFIGSNSALVAPVRIGEGAIVAAGSTITRDVPDQALALGRSPQVHKADRAPEVRERLRARAAEDKA